MKTIMITADNVAYHSSNATSHMPSATRLTMISDEYEVITEPHIGHESQTMVNLSANIAYATNMDAESVHIYDYIGEHRDYETPL